MSRTGAGGQTEGSNVKMLTARCPAAQTDDERRKNLCDPRQPRDLRRKRRGRYAEKLGQHYKIGIITIVFYGRIFTGSVLSRKMTIPKLVPLA
ncbi:hypothetical protein AOLI_G00265590 [Acnodon oligacanthus]